MYYLGILISWQTKASIFLMNVLPDVYIYPLRKYTSTSWGDNKMYTSGSIADSQRMRAKINKSGAIGKTDIWMESDTTKHFKAFRIISSKMPISLLILWWWYFSCLRIQRFLFIYFPMSLKHFFKSLCPRYTGQLFWKVDIIFINKLQISWRICFNFLTQMY